LGRLRRSPRLLAGFEGLTSKRREGKGETVIKGRGRDKKERNGKERNGGEGRGKGREGRRGGVHCAVGIFNYFRLCHYYSTTLRRRFS